MIREKTLLEYLNEGNKEIVEKYIKEDILLKPLKYMTEGFLREFMDDIPSILDVKVDSDGLVKIRCGMYEGLAKILPNDEIQVIKKIGE